MREKRERERRKKQMREKSKREIEMGVEIEINKETEMRVEIEINQETRNETGNVTKKVMRIFIKRVNRGKNYLPPVRYHQD